MFDSLHKSVKGRFHKMNKLIKPPVFIINLICNRWVQQRESPLLLETESLSTVEMVLYNLWPVLYKVGGPAPRVTISHSFLFGRNCDLKGKK